MSPLEGDDLLEGHLLLERASRMRCPSGTRGVLPEGHLLPELEGDVLLEGHLLLEGQ